MLSKNQHLIASSHLILRLPRSLANDVNLYGQSSQLTSQKHRDRLIGLFDHHLGQQDQTVKHSSDDRSAMARAYGLAMQITTIALEMALPALGGFWLDGKLGTKFLFLIFGAALGFAVGFWHLLQLGRGLNQHKNDKQNDD